MCAQLTVKSITVLSWSDQVTVSIMNLIRLILERMWSQILEVVMVVRGFPLIATIDFIAVSYRAVLFSESATGDELAWEILRIRTGPDVMYVVIFSRSFGVL